MAQGLPFNDFKIRAGDPRTAVSAAARPFVSLELRAWKDFDRGDRIAAWDALAQFASEPNPFFESWYLLPSLAQLDPDGQVELLVLEADGQLAGLMPIKRERSYYGHPLPHFRNWAHANSFLGAPLVAKGFERTFWRHLLDWADRHARLRLFLHLVHLPASGALWDALVQETTASNRPSAIVLRESRAMLSSDLPPDDYLAASVTAKKRKELRRQHRRLAEEGELTIDVRDDDLGLDGWIRDFLELEAKGWKGSSGSALASAEPTREVFHRALPGAARRGKLNRVTLRLDDRPIAMLANFISRPGAFSYKTAFDEDFARFSPGVLLQCENLAILDRDGIEWVDSCAASDHPMIDHIWRERRTIARCSIGIGGRLRRAAFRQIARRETGRPVGGIA